MANSINQSINQSINHSFIHSFIHSFNRSLDRSIDQFLYPKLFQKIVQYKIVVALGLVPVSAKYLRQLNFCYLLTGHYGSEIAKYRNGNLSEFFILEGLIYLTLSSFFIFPKEHSFSNLYIRAMQ